MDVTAGGFFQPAAKLNGPKGGGLIPNDSFYVSDLDGTLLTNEGQLSDYTRQTLTRLLKAGLPFTAASARSVVSMREVLKDLPLAFPVIEHNGAFISDFKTGRHEIINAIEPEIVEGLMRLIHDRRQVPVLSAFDGERDRVYYSQIINDGMALYLKGRQKQNDPRLRQVEKFEPVLGQAIVCMTVIGKREELKPFEKVFQDQYGLRIETHCFEDLYSPGWHWLTLHDRRATKDQAIRILQEKQGLQDKELVVFGDHINDIKMFKIAGRSIAVENAQPELKRHAHQVIEANEKDSVARFLEEDWEKRRRT